MKCRQIISVKTRRTTKHNDSSVGKMDLIQLEANAHPLPLPQMEENTSHQENLSLSDPFRHPPLRFKGVGKGGRGKTAPALWLVGESSFRPPTLDNMLPKYDIEYDEITSQSLSNIAQFCIYGILNPLPRTLTFTSSPTLRKSPTLMTLSYVPIPVTP